MSNKISFILIVIGIGIVITILYTNLVAKNGNKKPISTTDSSINKNNTLCDTSSLKPNDDTSKFITAIKCLDNQIYEMNKTAEKALASANEAKESAISAETAANRAASYAQDTNSKLDSMFRESMKR